MSARLEHRPRRDGAARRAALIAGAAGASTTRTLAFTRSVEATIAKEPLLAGQVSILASVQDDALVLRGTARDLLAHDLAVEIAESALRGRQREAARAKARSGELTRLLGGDPGPVEEAGGSAARFARAACRALAATRSRNLDGEVVGEEVARPSSRRTTRWLLHAREIKTCPARSGSFAIVGLDGTREGKRRVVARRRRRERARRAAGRAGSVEGGARVAPRGKDVECGAAQFSRATLPTRARPSASARSVVYMPELGVAAHDPPRGCSRADPRALDRRGRPLLEGSRCEGASFTSRTPVSRTHEEDEPVLLVGHVGHGRHGVPRRRDADRPARERACDEPLENREGRARGAVESS